MGPALQRGKGKAAATSPAQVHAKSDAEYDYDDIPPVTPTGGKVFVDSNISHEELYVLDWEQIRRMAERCGFWWRESMDNENGVIRTPTEHAQLASAELQKLYTRIDYHKDRRMRFVRKLGKMILEGVEGPGGLGCTTKAEFEQTVILIMIDLDIVITVDDFEFFSRIREVEKVREQMFREAAIQKQKRRNTVLKRKPSLASIMSQDPRSMSNMVSEDSMAGAQSSARVSHQPSPCNGAVQ
ncbi:Hypothetical protein D9617_13g099770 [Elsinoe fawcettii]|nr:Hypothetical protein D9617_13g099770 [Elsinoe fawcettii]